MSYLNTAIKLMDTTKDCKNLYKVLVENRTVIKTAADEIRTNDKLRQIWKSPEFSKSIVDIENSTSNKRERLMIAYRHMVKRVGEARGEATFMIGVIVFNIPIIDYFMDKCMEGKCE